MAPLVRRSWAPCGQTPILYQRGRARDKVSIIAALTLSPRASRRAVLLAARRRERHHGVVGALPARPDASSPRRRSSSSGIACPVIGRAWSPTTSIAASGSRSCYRRTLRSSTPSRSSGPISSATPWPTSPRWTRPTSPAWPPAMSSASGIGARSCARSSPPHPSFFLMTRTLLTQESIITDTWERRRQVVAKFPHTGTWTRRALQRNSSELQDKNGGQGGELNPRHQDFQSCALPTELPAHHKQKSLAKVSPGVYLRVMRPRFLPAVTAVARTGTPLSGGGLCNAAASASCSLR